MKTGRTEGGGGGGPAGLSDGDRRRGAGAQGGLGVGAFPPLNSRVLGGGSPSRLADAMRKTRHLAFASVDIYFRRR